MTVLTLTPTLGRQSTRYPNGRPYQSVWSGPDIVFPRPASERTDGSGSNLGLHTVWDKFPADVEWFVRIGVRFGAFPYKVELLNETVDGASASTGISYAKYIEDDSATTPYLALRHTGFSAPSAGTRVYAWTIQITDCEGETATVPVSLTVYAQDHASFLSNFVWFDPTAGSNGPGTFASPCNKLSGPAVDGNSSIVGSSWSGTSTGKAKTVMMLCKGTGVIQMNSSMTSPPDGGETYAWFLGTRGPRQVYCIPGSNLEYRIESGVTQRIRMWEIPDGLIYNLTVSCAAGTTTNSGINGTHYRRCAVYDVTFRDLELVGSNVNPGALNGGHITGYHGFFSHITDDGIFTNENGVNLSGICCFISPQTSLLDKFDRAPGQAGGTQYNNFDFRFKHSSTDTEVRRMSAPHYASRSCSYDSWGWTTDAGNHIRGVLRYANIGTTVANTLYIQSGSTVFDGHSVMTHFCTLKGTIDHGTTYHDDVENAGEFHAYGNIIENASHATNYGWGTMDADYRIVSGKGALIENSISGAIGTLVDNDGNPLSAAHRGVYGHTVIE